VVITVPILGDIDLDGDVDKNDVNLIVAARKGTILCTRPGCAAQ